MSTLLDTQAFLWFVTGDSRLSAAARAAIEDPAAAGKLISIASAWEMAIKTSLGKLILAEPFGILVPRELHRNGFRLYPIELRHLSTVASLPFHHRDPFDRLIAAQAMEDGLTVVSSDAAFDAYGVKRVW